MKYVTALSSNTDKNVERCTDHIAKYLEWSIVTKQKFTVKIQDFQIHKVNNNRIFKFKIGREKAKVKLHQKQNDTLSYNTQLQSSN